MASVAFLAVVLVPGAASAATASRGFAASIGGSPHPGWASILSKFGPGTRLHAASPQPAGIPGTAPTVLVGDNPVGDIVDTTTHTVYVANGNDNTVSVINAATCNDRDTLDCGEKPATVNVGQGPLAFALDEATHTLYVSNLGNNTISMIDTAICNAEEPAGCGQAPVTVAVGNGPALLAVDQATDTVYVPNSNTNTVSVLDGATCNATVQSACGAVANVVVGSGASAVVLNQRTGTAYVANFNVGTVSAFGTSACNAILASGCGTVTTTGFVGPDPSALVVDQASGTVYVQVGPLGTATNVGWLAMINGAQCNATIANGCAQAPATTPVGSGPIWLAEDQFTRTVYAVNQEDSDISVINAGTCNAIAQFGCRPTPFTLAIGGNTAVVPGLPDYGAGAVAVDPTTNTLYATSQAEGNVSVLNGSTCDAFDTTGCTQSAPTTTVGTGPQGIAVDVATGTVYAANQNDGTVSVVDVADCNAERLWGCRRAWPTVKVGDFPQAVAVDDSADTIYVANLLGATVSVINGADCNGANPSGCGLSVATIPVGQGPDALAVNEATGTLYVANGGANNVSVINVASCDGTDQSACVPIATVAAGNGPGGLAVEQATNTLYTANTDDGTVSVINGSTCDALHTSGCKQSAPAVTVGAGPLYLAYDQSDSTLYVNNGAGNSLSLINAETCNAVVTASCTVPAPTVPVEGLPSGLAVDAGTGLLYVTSTWDSDVSTINTATCNAGDTTGCQVRNLSFRLGGWPTNPVLVPSDSTLYAVNNVDGDMSVVDIEGS